MESTLSRILLASTFSSVTSIVLLLDPVFGTSRFGNPTILVGKYKFWAVHNRKTQTRKRWYCSFKGCRATLFTENDVIVKTKGEHNHQ